MKEIILIKNGEIALKGQNRGTFEEVLISNIKRRLIKLGKFDITRAQSTITVIPRREDFDVDRAVEALTKVFGIAYVCRAGITEKDMDIICKETVEYLEEILEDASTFKVVAKRSDKKFPLKSPEICREVGGYILSKFHHLKVDVNNPEVTVSVEIRDTNAYVHIQPVKGIGGMPVGSSGKSMLLISGGIDSPVAAYMMAKRGLELSAVHFASPPYTGERAKQKVLDLLQKISEYCGRIRMYCVGFTKAQEQIRDLCPEDHFTLVMRRIMMRVAEKMAIKNNLTGLITGESLAQVASQTLLAMASTDSVVSTMPIFRPLVGMDKEEIVTISRKIGTFDISILPYEDCCTVFTPKHPKTKPSLEGVAMAESGLDIESIVDDCVENAEVWEITPYSIRREDADEQ